MHRLKHIGSIGKHIGLTLLLLVIGAGSAGNAYGQRQDTVYQTLTTNHTTTSFIGTVQNIGQSFHQAVLSIVDRSGQTCDTTADTTSPVAFGFSASYDNINIFPIGVSVIQSYTTTNYFETISAVGAYPFIYATVGNVNGTKCQYTLTYSGTIQGAVIPPNHLMQSFSANTAATSNISAGSKGIAVVSLYGLILSNDTANQTITIGCTGSNATFGSPLVLNKLEAGQIVIIPDQALEILSCRVGSTQHLTITLANATQVNGQLYYGFK